MQNFWLNSSSDEGGDFGVREEQRVVHNNRRKYYRLRVNFDFENDAECNERFRMRRNKVELLIQKIGLRLQHSTKKGGALSPKQQICIALHWLGSGAQFHTVADMHGVHKSTVCRTVAKVVHAVNNELFNEVVTWPEDIAEETNRFYQIANFPHVIGVIDGSLIPIDSPTVNEEAFVDRKGDHSLNCMFVCGASGMFYYVIAKWPGSVHDARVLRNSVLYNRMEEHNLFPNALLLGDSAYPLRTWLMTPLHHNPNDVAERKYNRRLKATRQVIERALGILKEKFPCLNYLRINPTYAGSVVKCCATLCNFARSEENEIVILANEEAEVLEENYIDQHEDPEVLYNEVQYVGGRIRQQQILQLMV